MNAKNTKTAAKTGNRVDGAFRLAQGLGLIGCVMGCPYLFFLGFWGGKLAAQGAIMLLTGRNYDEK